MKTLAEICKEREAAALRYQQDKEVREATGVPGRVSLLKVTPDVGFAFRPVHDYDQAADFMYHTYNGDLPCSEICHEHYDGGNCKYHPIDNPSGLCKKPSTLYGDRFAVATKFMLGHVYNLIGKEYDFTSKENGERIQGVHKPLKLIGIPFGKKDAFIKPFLAAHKTKTYKDTIFLIKRIKGSGWEVPEAITEQELKDLLGEKVPLALPAEYSKYTEMGKRNLWKLMLTAMPNARVDELLGPEPVKTVAADTDNPFAPTVSVKATVVKDNSIDAAF